MRGSYFIQFLLVLLVGCTAGRKQESQEKLSLRFFELPYDRAKNAPAAQEVDSCWSGKIIFQEDTLHFEFGYVIDNLSECDRLVIVDPHRTDTTAFDSTIVKPAEVVFVRKTNYDIDRIRKQNVFFDSVDGFSAKTTVPRVAGNGGIVGLHVDSLRSDSGGELKFSIYAQGGDSNKTTS